MLVERKEIYSGRVIKVSVDTVDLPNGMRVPLELVRHPGGAAAVAIDAENRVCLLRQFRHAADGFIYELPAGKLEPHEPPEATVKRELVEEAATSAAR
jgi:8-oxo-dGTP pyrophosphatase MutT (NUDIX family)